MLAENKLLSFAGKLRNFDVFTGANNLADKNHYFNAGTNVIFDPNNLPFGIHMYIDHFTVSKLFINTIIYF